MSPRQMMFVWKKGDQKSPAGEDLEELSKCIPPKAEGAAMAAFRVLLAGRGLHRQPLGSQECLTSIVNAVSQPQSVWNADILQWVPVVFVLPGVIVILFYVSILWLHIYKRKNEIKEAYSHDAWIGANEVLATLWDGHGRLWHGYELHGVENIPEGPGLVVFYHGATPVDYIYFSARLHIMTKRRCRVVADHFVFRLPGFRILIEVLGILHGPKEACVRTLEKGHLLAIAPGGVREALFSDEMYTILWSDRKGFAQVAIDAKVPIIPMFTQNVREGFRTLGGIKLVERNDSLKIMKVSRGLEYLSYEHRLRELGLAQPGEGSRGGIGAPSST
ncbi:hypothetical protein DUI87_07580 [Hirundo rustica rustica]|uniref:Phospholipid/glycerol acyltransferase domain-containing protein n=1 Tax=Hirundo rustica rustica TaxID=333673 RepID=A0A3M0KQ37_HIRRU|nr:hypothetical protein DUI87_07580 [Hirundo rustica rustica]